MMRWLWLIGLMGLIGPITEVRAQSASLPAKPTRYVSDRAFVLDEPTADALNARLEAFEKETSNQVVVAIFANLPEQAEIAQYSTQVFRSWKVGQAGKDNGVVLFVYKNDHKLFIATGRGLEGALPDVTCQQIIANEIVPKFKSGDFSGGISAGVEAILAATKGEYKGTGGTADQGNGTQFVMANLVTIIKVVVILIFIIQFVMRARNGGNTVVNRRGYSSLGAGWLLGSGSSWGGGGGGFGSGGGGGGGFSGGGGSSGGGGAGGSW